MAEAKTGYPQLVIDPMRYGAEIGEVSTVHEFVVGKTEWEFTFDPVTAGLDGDYAAPRAIRITDGDRVVFEGVAMPEFLPNGYLRFTVPQADAVIRGR